LYYTFFTFCRTSPVLKKISHLDKKKKVALIDGLKNDLVKWYPGDRECKRQ